MQVKQPYHFAVCTTLFVWCCIFGASEIFESSPAEKCKALGRFQREFNATCIFFSFCFFFWVAYFEELLYILLLYILLVYISRPSSILSPHPKLTTNPWLGVHSLARWEKMCCQPEPWRTGSPRLPCIVWHSSQRFSVFPFLIDIDGQFGCGMFGTETRGGVSRLCHGGEGEIPL